RFFGVGLEPPSQQRQQRSRQCSGARVQVSLRHTGQSMKLSEALLDRTGEVALRKLIEVIYAAAVNERPIEFLLVSSVSEELRDGHDPTRVLLLGDEHLAHHSEESFEDAEEQVLLTFEMPIKRRTYHSGPIQHLLNRDFIHRLFLHQLA